MRLTSSVESSVAKHGDGGRDDVEQNEGSEFLGSDQVPRGVCACIEGGIVGGTVQTSATSEVLPPLPTIPLRAGVEAPVPIKRVDVQPVYPRAARAAGIRGIVVLDAIIDEDGRVIDVKVMRSTPGLDRAAIEAVRKWRYDPAIVDGRAVPVILSVTARFVL